MIWDIHYTQNVQQREVLQTKEAGLTASREQGQYFYHLYKHQVVSRENKGLQQKRLG